MPFYIRKSVSAGPFRLNFSKGGLGMSVGVKGLRIGTGPRGHYVHAGRGGLYYRSSIGRPGQKRIRPSQAGAPSRGGSHSPSPYDADGVHMVEIESGDVLQMRDAQFADLLDDINANAARTPLGKLTGWVGIILGLICVFIDASVGLLVWGLTIPAWLSARWLDSYQRRSVLFYDLEPDALDAYRALTEAFDVIVACDGKWHVAAGGAVQDLTTWKRNAGATHVVRKQPITPAYALPAIIACNLTPPAIPVGAQTLYLLPDVVLIVHGKTVGAVGYADLDLRWDDSNFIEEGKVPGDALVVGHTWKHPNKRGGPDRRFKHNYQIPVCRYDLLHFKSASGLNELVEFSRLGVSRPLVQTAHRLAQLNGRITVPHRLAGG